MLFKDVIVSPILNNTIRIAFQGKPFKVVERPGSFCLLLEKELTNEVNRILILKPKGFTSNNLNELSSHPEAREATIEVKGIVREGKQGYFLAKNCLEFVYYPNKKIETITNYPYANSNKALKIIKNSRTKFKIVKRNGYGFYHNLVNLTDEWLVLILRKKLDLTKNIEYKLLDNCTKEEKTLLMELLEEVETEGDEIFKKKTRLINKITALETKISLPVLISFLNIPEKSNHEQCTIFAIILKIAKNHSKLAQQILKNALEKHEAQEYYLKELIKKT